jgi:hypothetical protein
MPFSFSFRRNVRKALTFKPPGRFPDEQECSFLHACSTNRYDDLEAEPFHLSCEEKAKSWSVILYASSFLL